MFKEEIQKDLDTFVEKIQKEVEDLDKKKKEVEEEVQKFEIIKTKLETTAKNAKEKIKLNIGGKIFTTSLTTLTQVKGTFFSAMFSGQFNTEPDEDGEYFIDRDSVYFPIILNHLRYPDQKVDFSLYLEKHLELIMFETEFYGIETLKAQIPQFKVLMIGKCLTSQRLSCTKYRVTKNLTNGWNSAVAFTQCKKWKVIPITHGPSFMVGVMNKDSINVDGTNYSSFQFGQNASDRCFIHSSNGYKYPNQSGYGERFDTSGNYIIFEYKDGDLICEINGKSYGKVMSGLSDDWVPLIEVNNSSATFDVEFLE